MGVAVTGACMGGGGCADVRNGLHHDGSGGPPLRVGDVGHVPTDWEGALRFKLLGDTEADGEHATSEQGRDMDVSSPVEGNLVSGHAGGGDLRRPTLKNATQFIATNPIMDLCLAAAQYLGVQVLKRWWKQEGINMEGIQEADRVVGADRYFGEQTGE